MIEEHAREAAELSALRATLLVAPDRSLFDLAALDERIEAHLDGLRIAGRGAARLAERATDLGGSEELFVSATLAFESGDDKRIAFVADAACSDPRLRRAVAAALAWLSREQAEAFCNGFARSSIASLRWVALSAATSHRIELTSTLESALVDEDAGLRARALVAIGELGLRSRAAEVGAGLESDEAECRFAAASSGALLAVAGAAPVLCDLALVDVPFREAACRFAAARLPLGEARAWVRRLREQGHARLAAIAAGSSGDAMLVPALLDWAQAPELARVCGEAITTITGIRIAGDLATPPSALERAGIEEASEDVVRDPDEGLEEPNLPRLAEACARAPRTDGERWLLGRARVEPWLVQVLRHGRQRERGEAARALAMSAGTGPLFEIRARGERQLCALSAMGAR